MPINSPYHSTMEKEIKKAANIVDSFFNSTLDADKQVPLEFIQHAHGIAFLTIVKAGFVWTGKIGTGVVISRLEDGTWSPPSAIGTAGVGFGAEVGGEIVDFMIILGSAGAVQTFKRSGQISIGAGLELAVGPFGRAAGGNLNVSASGLGANYTYSHAKGIYGGIGLRGSVIVSRPDMNKRFYGVSSIKPMQILCGNIEAPPGSCNRLWDALSRAERGGRPSSEIGYEGPGTSQAGLAEQTYGGTAASASASTALGKSGSMRGTGGATDFRSSEVDPQNDPRLRRYRTEQEVWAKYSAKKGDSPETTATPVAIQPPMQATVPHTMLAPNTPPSSAPPAAVAAATVPSNHQNTVSEMPSQATGKEQEVVYKKVMEFVRVQTGDSQSVKAFKEQCKIFGQSTDASALPNFTSYLHSTFSPEALHTLLPDLVRLLPTQEKREGLWALYTQ